MITRIPAKKRKEAARCSFRLIIEASGPEAIVSETGHIWESICVAPPDHPYLRSDQHPVIILVVQSRVNPFRPLREHVMDVLKKVEPIRDVLRRFAGQGAVLEVHIRHYGAEEMRTIELPADLLGRICDCHSSVIIQSHSLGDTPEP